MTHVHSDSPTHRFAWLTPLHGQKTSTGPWVLCENRTQHLDNIDIPCVNITVNALLHLLATSFNTDELDGQKSVSNYDGHVSECGRFEVRKHQQDNCSSRLFVQQRTDYFQRLELYVDKQLVAAYHEPVWPHLQHPHPAAGSRLTIPIACVELLENAARELVRGYNMSVSANQAHCDDTDETRVA